MHGGIKEQNYQMNLVTIHAQLNYMLFCYYFILRKNTRLCTCVQLNHLSYNSLATVISTLGFLCSVKRNLSCVLICNQ